MDEKLKEAGLSDSSDSLAEPEEIVRTNIGWMLSLAERIVGDKSLAQDAVQDAFLNIFNSLEKFEGRSSLKSWMHRITVNSSLKKLAKQKQQKEQSIDEFLPEFDERNCRIEGKWVYLAEVDEMLDQDEVISTVREKIHELPEIYRIVLLLRDIEGYSSAEVAEILDISESNVKVRLHRSRAALKKLLEQVLRGEGE